MLGPLTFEVIAVCHVCNCFLCVALVVYFPPLLLLPSLVLTDVIGSKCHMVPFSLFSLAHQLYLFLDFLSAVA